MELKSKDLQQYLNKNKISTHGLVGKFSFPDSCILHFLDYIFLLEKTELVELFCQISIPVRYKKSNKKFPAHMGGSVPDLASRSQHYFNNLRGKHII